MKKIISALLALIIVFSLSVQVFAANPVEATEEWLENWDERASSAGKVWITPGKNERSLNFTWLSKKSGCTFSFKKADNASWEQAKVSVLPSAYGKINTASLTDLDAGSYIYKYTADGRDYAETPFTISEKNTGFKMMFATDPQLGRSGSDSLEAVQNDAYGWERSLYAAEKNGIDFILCAGDQVNDGLSAMQFNAFLSPQPLKSIPMATATGNHEFMSAMQSLFFRSSGVPQIENDYYFSYGSALFIVIDSNDIAAGVHEAVINNAVKANPDAKWRIVMMHHTPYGSGRDDIANKVAKTIFPSLFDKYDIDLVLCGHDHYYSRTHPLLNNEISENGTVYFTGNSASGGKCNHFDPDTTGLTAFETDLSAATYSVLEFSDEAIKVVSYITDTDEVFDTFEILCTEKSDTVPEFGLLQKIKAFFDYLKNFITVKLHAIFEKL